VLHAAALGGNGPGWSGQLAFEVHCAPVMLHLPTAGHSLDTVCPAVLHVVTPVLGSVPQSQ
jgi:hypothetical protein